MTVDSFDNFKDALRGNWVSIRLREAGDHFQEMRRSIEEIVRKQEEVCHS